MKYNPIVFLFIAGVFLLLTMIVRAVDTVRFVFFSLPRFEDSLGYGISNYCAIAGLIVLIVGLLLLYKEK